MQPNPTRFPTAIAGSRPAWSCGARRRRWSSTAKCSARASGCASPAHEAIADAGRLIARAASLKRLGPYQLQAAIVACHAEAGRWEDTDWTQILVLYDMLLQLAPSPVTRLHRAIATRYVQGPAAALSEVDSLSAE